MRHRRWGLLVCGALVVAGCAARVRPLPGVALDGRLPSAELFDDARRYRFEWRYRDETFEASGDGVVRVQPPRQARLDFFLSNGLAGGVAILDGDSVLTPGPDFVRRLVPPSPVLWSVFGALRLPASRDTVARRLGDTVLADFGRTGDGRLWRVRFIGAQLDRLERIEDGRRIEWVERQGGAARYAHEPSRRRLTITVIDSALALPTYDPSLFRLR